MYKNLGTTDRVARWVIASIILILYFTGILTGVIATILIVLSIVFAITGTISFCPIYLLFGINNYIKKQTPDE